MRLANLRPQGSIWASSVMRRRSSSSKHSPAFAAQHELDHIGRNRKLAPELADQILAHHAAESLFIGHFATLGQVLN